MRTVSVELAIRRVSLRPRRICLKRANATFQGSGGDARANNLVAGRLCLLANSRTRMILQVADGGAKLVRGHHNQCWTSIQPQIVVASAPTDGAPEARANFQNASPNWSPKRPMSRQDASTNKERLETLAQSVQHSILLLQNTDRAPRREIYVHNFSHSNGLCAENSTMDSPDGNLGTFPFGDITISRRLGPFGGGGGPGARPPHLRKHHSRPTSVLVRPVYLLAVMAPATWLAGWPLRAVELLNETVDAIIGRLYRGPPPHGLQIQSTGQGGGGEKWAADRRQTIERVPHPTGPLER